MSFDFAHLHIEDGSPEGRTIQAIVERERVAPEEALRRALRSANQAPNLEVAQESPIFGMFADRPEFGEAIARVIAHRADRYGDAP